LWRKLNSEVLVDECTSKDSQFLRENAGYNVIFAGEWKPHATDEEVLKRAEEHDRILIIDGEDIDELVLRKTCTR